MILDEHTSVLVWHDSLSVCVHVITGLSSFILIVACPFNAAAAEVKETELDQVSGGVNDLPENEYYINANEIDLLNTDFLPEKCKK